MILYKSEHLNFMYKSQDEVISLDICGFWE